MARLSPSSSDQDSFGAAGPSVGYPTPKYEVFLESRVHGIFRRFLTITRHFWGLVIGGQVAYLRSLPKRKRRGLRYWFLLVSSWFTRPFVNRELIKQPFPVQLRKRLEALGPTFIKLGQILSLREDILPKPVTDELKNLYSNLPALPFPRFAELVSIELGQPVDTLFSWIEPVPMGSASIGQAHRATTLAGESVVLKLVKPGIRTTVKQDIILLKSLGRFLQLFLSRFQPRYLIDEFGAYTLRELDLRNEAENAETFTANFKDDPDIVFPRIYRELSSRDLLVMEYLAGVEPGDPTVEGLPPDERDRIVDLGAEAIIRMLYKDGFFHADLHPGNLLVLAGPKAGFIDLGMVGRFDDELRQTLLYYYYCMVMGDAQNAARYLASIAEAGRGGDRRGFKRDVEEISRRWHRNASFEDFSIAQLIMESVGRAANHRMYLPVEMVLMVKAIVTFEAVGHLLKPGFDVAEVSREHINKIFLHQFSPIRIAQETLRGAPDLVDALAKAPMLVTEGLKVLEKSTQREPENPFSGIRGTVFAGFCIVAGAIVAASNGPWPLCAVLFGTGLIVALRPKD
jgi:ubiquinone biosynthesis protein